MNIKRCKLANIPALGLLILKQNLQNIAVSFRLAYIATGISYLSS